MDAHSFNERLIPFPAVSRAGLNEIRHLVRKHRATIDVKHEGGQTYSGSVHLKTPTYMLAEAVDRMEAELRSAIDTAKATA